MSEPVKIVPSVLRKQVEDGWKMKPLADHYGLPVSQMKRALKSLDLTIRKFHAPKFVIVEEEVTEEVAQAEVEAVEGTLEEATPEVEEVEAELEEEVEEESTQEETVQTQEEEEASRNLTDW